MHRDRDYGARFNQLLRSEKLELFDAKALDYEAVIGVGYDVWRVLFNMFYITMVAVGAYLSYVVFSTSLIGMVLWLIEILLAGVMLAQVIHLMGLIRSWCRAFTNGLNRALVMADCANNCTN